MKVHLGCPYSTFKELATARSKNQVSRKNYLEWVGPLTEDRNRARVMARSRRRKGKPRWQKSKRMMKAARADYHQRISRHWSF
jgi:hypothetical protein